MIEKLENLEKYPERIPAMSEQVLNRLERLGETLGTNLREEFGSQIMPFVDETDGTVSFDEFIQVVRNMSLRPESLCIWDDDYFDEQFEETVRIARERRDYDTN